MADRSSGNTLMTSPGGHSIDALCYCLGEFKELSSIVANQRQQIKNLFVESANQSVRLRLQPSIELRAVPGAATIRSDHR
jgi:hypothetical protein